MKKTIILFIFINLFIILYSNEDSINLKFQKEDSSKDKVKDFITYSIEKNFYPSYEYIEYKNSKKDIEEDRKMEQDIFFKSKGKKKDFEFNIIYSDKEELEKDNILYGKYKQIEIGDIETEFIYKSKHFNNRTKLFGTYINYKKNFLLADINKNRYVEKKVDLNYSEKEVVFSDNSYIKNKFIKYDVEKIDKIYFEDFDQTNNDEQELIDGRYYTEYIFEKDYIIYKNYIELIEAKDGNVVIFEKDGTKNKVEFSKTIFLLDIQDANDYNIEFYKGNRLLENYRYSFDKNNNRLILYNDIDDDMKIIVNYYIKTNIIQIGEIEKNSLTVYQGNKRLEKNVDYFYDIETGIVTFMDNIIINPEKIALFYKRQRDEKSVYLASNLNYNKFNIRYDYELNGLKRDNKIGLIYNGENSYAEIGMDFYNPNIENEKDVIDLENIYNEHFISTKKDYFLYNEKVEIIDDEKNYEGEEDIEEKLKIKYESKGRIRRKLRGNNKGDIVDFYIYGDNSNNKMIIRLGRLSEDFDLDGNLDTEDKNSNGYLEQEEDTGIYINEIKIGENNEVLNSEDLNQNGVLDTEDNYVEIVVELNFFGWKNVIKNIPKNTLDEFEVFEIEFDSIDNKPGTVILGSAYIKENGIKTNEVTDFNISEEIKFTGNSENSHIEYKIDSINNFNKIKVDLYSKENVTVKIELDNEVIYSGDINEEENIELDISNIDKLYSMKIYSNGQLRIKNINFYDSKKEINDFYYLRLNKKNNIFEYSKIKTEEFVGLRNEYKNSKILYNIYKEIEDEKVKKQLYVETQFDKMLNFRYKYFEENDFYREYDSFYLFNKNKIGIIYREEDYYKYYLDYKKEKFKTNHEIRQEKESSEYESKGNVSYLDKTLKSSYKYNKNNEFENSFTFFISDKELKRSADFKITKKKDYWFDYEKLGSKIGKYFRLDIKRENEIKYENYTEKWFFPIFNINYSKDKKRINFDFEYQLEENYIVSKLNLFYKIFKWDFEYNEKEKTDIKSKFLLFIGEKFELNIDTNTTIDEKMENKLKLQNSYVYTDEKERFNIEITPFIGLENFKDYIETYNSYDKYEIGCNLKISM